MPRPQNKKEVVKRLCGLCDKNYLNYPEDDVYCYLNEPVKALYCRPRNEWVMPCNSQPRDKWVSQWVETGEKPAWTYAHSPGEGYFE